jgi:hypothetical protein
MSHTPHRNNHQYSIEDLKRLASGRWREIVTAAGHFYDPELANIKLGAQVWVCEGTSNTPALMSVGLDVIGIPSAKSGVGILLREIVIVADGDSPTSLTSSQREREISRAEREATEAGT